MLPSNHSFPPSAEDLFKTQSPTSNASIDSTPVNNSASSAPSDPLQDSIDKLLSNADLVDSLAAKVACCSTKLAINMERDLRNGIIYFVKNHFEIDEETANSDILAPVRDRILAEALTIINPFTDSPNTSLNVPVSKTRAGVQYKPKHNKHID